MSNVFGTNNGIILHKIEGLCVCLFAISTKRLLDRFGRSTIAKIFLCQNIFKKFCFYKFIMFRVDECRDINREYQVALRLTPGQGQSLTPCFAPQLRNQICSAVADRNLNGGFLFFRIGQGRGRVQPRVWSPGVGGGGVLQRGTG